MKKKSSLPKKSKIKIVFIVLLSFAVVVMTAAMLAFRLYLNNIQAVSEYDEEIAFTVQDDPTLNDLIFSLYNENLIKDPTCAKIYARIFLPNDYTYYAGNYILNKTMNVEQIFEYIGDVDNCVQEEVTVTLPDGVWVKEAVEIIAKSTNLNSKDIMEKWNDIDYVYSLINKYEFLTEEIFDSEHCYLEGYIFPDTYVFFAKTTIEQVTEKILDNTNRAYQAHKDEFANIKYSIHDVFTLSSIIQAESGSPEDNRLIASVFYNRLNTKMPLQSSPTVCYALYKFSRWQDCEELSNQQVDSKYNTYVYRGIPVGPICNFNEMALSAALNPAESDYYFFIGARGKTYFSKTYEEHLKLCEKYLY